MSGSISGGAERLKKAPNAHFVYCLTHCLNLAVSESDADKMVPLSKNSLDRLISCISWFHLFETLANVKMFSLV